MAARRRTVAMDHPIVLTFLIMAIVGAMALAADVLRPLALAVLLSFALEPVARFLETRVKLPRTAAVVLTVVTALGALGAVGYVVGEQLTSLASRLPAYEENVLAKVQHLRPAHETVLEKANRVAKDVAATLDQTTGEQNKGVVDVRVVSRSSLREQITTAVGPYLEMLGMGFLVLVLVLFILLNREDLRERIVQLFGRGRITLTTRTMDEVGRRISRYLVMLATVNTGFGVLVGIGLALIGLPYAVLWGFLAGALRFIPYAGPSVAFLLPMLFSIAHFPAGQWQGPIEVLVLFMVLELLANVAIEPVIYGRTTGVWALGLLVSAMFWTWLWGMLGLLLSTPMTVCLAVLGKYVPSLGFFATMLGEEAELAADLRFYQRLLALDQDGATEIAESALERQPRVEVFDQVLLPALYRSQRDYSDDSIDENEQAFIWRVISQIIDELEGIPEPPVPIASTGNGVKPATSAANGVIAASGDRPTARIIGVPASDEADVLVLRMLDNLLQPAGLSVEIIADAATPLNIADRVAEMGPGIVVVSHVPPTGLTPTRYLVRRLRARFADLPLVVGRWSKVGGSNVASERLSTAGASQVVLSLAEACEAIVGLIPRTASPPPPIPEPVGAAVGPQ